MDGEALTIETSAWGRDGALVPFDAAEPDLGTCTTELDARGKCIRRLEREGVGITEWWIGMGTGLEQGWTVDRRPEGEGDLVVTVEVGGAMWVEGGAGQATITDADGRSWGVSRIAAWDAGGEPLPARVVVVEGGLRVEVDDTGASYPVEIDPVYTTAAWTAAGAPYSIASSRAGAGDVNGDGYDDVIVGAPGYSAYRGRAYVYAGGPSGVSTTAMTALTGEADGDYFGTAVASAGDVNGDGYDDVIVGAASANRAYVYVGSSAGISPSAPVTLIGETWEGYNSDFGVSAASAGDVNGDGYDDVIVGACDYDYFRGRAYLYLGSLSGVSTTATTTLNGQADYDRFGAAVGGAGDVTGDGYDDVIVGALGYSSGTGRAYVYLGSLSGVSSTATTTLTGEAPSNGLGSCVASTGDVNADGYDDVIVGASGYSYRAGRVYVHAGSSSGVATTAMTTLTGDAMDDYFGASLSGVGDVNDDGFDDVIVGTHAGGGAFLYAGSFSGVSTTATTTLAGGGYVAGVGDVNGDGYDDVIVDSSVYVGSPSGVSTTATTTIPQDYPDHLGCSVASAGDVNGDGYDDVIVGAEGYLSYTGRAYVYTGSSGGLSMTAATTLTGVSTSSYFGCSVAGAGDVNGDGYDDVIIGARNYPSTSGSAFVYAGSPGGVSTYAATTLTGATYDSLGYSVAGAGDVNADGYDDVIVGVPEDPRTPGSALVYSGSSSGISTTPATTLVGELPGDYFGSSVASAGDVNGDGYDDVIVGAEWHSATGGAYVYAGSSGGLSMSASTTLIGEASWDHFGSSVAGAGDVNGDGYDDVIAGAYYRDRAYVYAGSSTGVAVTAAEVLSGPSSSGFGHAIAGAGDVNGDGYDDVIVGAYYASSGGEASLYSGGSSGLSTSPSTTLEGGSPGEFFGWSVAGAGDVNGDGYDDVIVGASAYDGYAGAVSAYLGHADTTDADGDGYDNIDGDGLPLDCDDTNAAYHPGASESDCADPNDYNCDGMAGLDGDGDGFGECDDCDDADPAIHPGALELCNTVDDDCDGAVDEDLEVPTWYADADGDGYADPDTSVAACDGPAGYLTATDPDCDDADAAVYPGATEVTDDGVDQDCDGTDAAGDTGGHKGGCGCAPGPGSGASGSLLLGALALTLRRRRPMVP